MDFLYKFRIYLYKVRVYLFQPEGKTGLTHFYTKMLQQKETRFGTFYTLVRQFSALGYASCRKHPTSDTSGRMTVFGTVKRAEFVFF